MAPHPSKAVENMLSKAVWKCSSTLRQHVFDAVTDRELLRAEYDCKQRWPPITRAAQMNRTGASYGGLGLASYVIVGDFGKSSPFLDKDKSWFVYRELFNYLDIVVMQWTLHVLHDEVGECDAND